MQLWVSLIPLKSERLVTWRKAGIFYWNPSYPSSYKLAYLFHTCSTTQCHKNYFEMPQNVETRRKKKIEQEKWNGNSPKISFKLSIFSVSEWRQHWRWSWETSPPPFHLHLVLKLLAWQNLFFFLNQPKYDWKMY